jgi:lysophospholipase L1-like esterase
MQMKKTLPLIIILFALLSFSACFGNNTNDSNKNIVSDNNLSDNNHSDNNLSDNGDKKPDEIPNSPAKPDNEQGGQTAFSNLSAAFIGDSITIGLCKGVVMQTPYPQGVADTLKLKSVTNLGIGGSTLCTKNYNSMVSRYATVPEGTNIIGVHGGVNDWAQNFTLGDITSTETRTIYGALDYLARNLKAKYPDAFIFFMTPTPVSDAKLEQYSATPYSLGDVAQAMKDVAEKYGFAVLDLYAVSGFESVCNDASKTDGVHPYQEFTTNSLVPLISEFIRENYAK